MSEVAPTVLKQIELAVERLMFSERELERQGITDEEREIFQSQSDAAVRDLAILVRKLVYKRNIPLPMKRFDKEPFA